MSSFSWEVVEGPTAASRFPPSLPTIRSRKVGAKGCAPPPSVSIARLIKAAGELMSLTSNRRERGHPAIVQAWGTGLYGRLTM